MTLDGRFQAPKPLTGTAASSYYQFFKDEYLREMGRSDIHRDRGKTYLTFVALYFSALVIREGSILGVVGKSITLTGLYISSIVALGTSMLLILNSLGARTYDLPHYPLQIIKDGELSYSTIEEFFYKRIFELAVATDTAHKTNMKKVNGLRYAGYAMAITVALHATIFLGSLHT